MPEFKLIVDIEVKHSKSSLNIASKQTNKHAIAFKYISEDWQFVKSACVLDYGEKEYPCTNCLNFIITEQKLGKPQDWLKTILNERKSYSEVEYYKEYIDLLFKMNIRSKDLQFKVKDLLKQSKETEERLIGRNVALDGENVEVIDTAEYKNSLCTKLTLDQKKVIEDTVSSIVIEGDHGTGKTFTLKKKATSCANSNHEMKIAYIMYNSNLSLMQLLTTTEKYPENIQKFSFDKPSNSNENEENDITKVLSQGKYHYVFIDEKPQHISIPWSSIGDTKIFVTVTKENNNLDSQLSENNKLYKKVFFKCNVRNSENVVNLSKAVSINNFVYSSR